MWSDGGPIDPSPTIDQAINGGYSDIPKSSEVRHCRASPSYYYLSAIGQAPHPSYH